MKVSSLLLGLQSEQEEEVVAAAAACGRLFCGLMERRELLVGTLPAEEQAGQ